MQCVPCVAGNGSRGIIGSLPSFFLSRPVLACAYSDRILSGISRALIVFSDVAAASLRGATPSVRRAPFNTVLTLSPRSAAIPNRGDWAPNHLVGAERVWMLDFRFCLARRAGGRSKG
jgi:hypothetical protein